MGFFDKIKAGLTKTRDALSGTLGNVFSGFSEIDDDFYDELEESLILADLGVDTAVKATDRLRRAVREQHLKSTEEAREALKDILVDMLNVGDTELNLSTKPSVILVIGVNGVGKTTTIGKLAKQLTDQGKKVLLIAGDTFRAAAADQLEIWAGRSGAGIVRQHEGADPASVVYDGIQSAKARDVDVILIDTAGARMAVGSGGIFNVHKMFPSRQLQKTAVCDTVERTDSRRRQAFEAKMDRTGGGGLPAGAGGGGDCPGVRQQRTGADLRRLQPGQYGPCLLLLE